MKKGVGSLRNFAGAFAKSGEEGSCHLGVVLGSPKAIFHSNVGVEEEK